MATANTARIAAVNGKPTLLVNDQPMVPMFYALTDSPGGRWTWEELPQQNLRQFAAAGVRLFQVDLFYELIYTEDNTLKLDVVCRQLRGVLDACPDAGIVIRLHMNPLPSWIAAHPEEWTRYADTEVKAKTYPGLYRPLADDLEPVPRASLASVAWRDDATRKLREVLAALARTPEGDSVIGIQPACGIFGEWHYWASLSHEPDTGVAMTAYFRQWLRAKYATDAALRQAWNDKTVTLDTAQVPDMSHRQRCLDGIFRDPVRERPMIDYLMAQHQCVAEDIIHFCRVVKEGWPRPIVTGTFYNYFLSLFGRASICGHLAVRKVLESPWVDFLSAPHAWNPDPRGLGCKQHRGMVSSCRLHNKLWLDELDTNTNLQGKVFARGIDSTLEEDRAIIRRLVTQAYAHGQGQWFYDFGPVSCKYDDTHAVAGWWDHPYLNQDIARLRATLETYHARPYKVVANVAMIYSQEAYYFSGSTAQQNPVSESLTHSSSQDIHFAGAAVDAFDLCDLERIDWDQYRAVFFGNVFFLSEPQRRFIRERVAQNGRHLFWNYLPGYTDGTRNDRAFVEELTGFKLGMMTPAEKTQVNVTAPGLPAAIFEGREPAKPVPVVQDSSAEALGCFAGTKEVGFARKKASTHTAWFASLPMRNADLFRAMFQLAGVHIYSDGGDVVYAGGGILSIHTISGGARRICLRNGQSLDLNLPPASTTILDEETGAVLMA